jgi:hypothetical protein
VSHLHFGHGFDSKRLPTIRSVISRAGKLASAQNIGLPTHSKIEKGRSQAKQTKVPLAASLV